MTGDTSGLWDRQLTGAGQRGRPGRASAGHRRRWIGGVRSAGMPWGECVGGGLYTTDDSSPRKDAGTDTGQDVQWTIVQSRSQGRPFPMWLCPPHLLVVVAGVGVTETAETGGCPAYDLLLTPFHSGLFLCHFDPRNSDATIIHDLYPRRSLVCVDTLAESPLLA